MRAIRSAVLALFVLTFAYGQSSPHGPLKQVCKDCHSTDSWKELAKPMKFDHATTGFTLQGAHSNAQCLQCHTNKKFAGTTTDCFKCHTSDFAKALQPNHQLGKFSHDCLSCHTMTGWKPSVFQHSKTNFQLVGAHLSVECASCHSNNRFSGLSQDCFSCHQKDFLQTTTPNHKAGQFSHDCVSCHTMTGWKPSTFDHNKTNFKLAGAHLRAECSSCHTNGKFKSIPSDCFSCHNKEFAKTTEPNHTRSKLSHNCLDCHTNNTWMPSTFDHNKTKLKLIGTHATAECSSCHASTKFSGLPTDCFTCHVKDLTGIKTIDHTPLSHDCSTCHNNMLWKPAKFDHNKTTFTLTGAHATAECSSCHALNKFPGLPTDCYSCHNLDFAKTVVPNHTLAQFSHDCVSCHSRASWKPSTFDHNKTNFQLAGAHKNAECSSCHTNGLFKGLPTDCYLCHQQDFTKTTLPNHSLAQFSHDCMSCHTSVTWKPSTFDHNKTNFKLMGAHTSAECSSCHTSGQFKGLPSDCYSCHQLEFSKTTTPNHLSSQFSHDCLTCHSNVAWKPSTFNHSTTAFPLQGAHVSVACASCHANGVYKGLPSDCFSCHQNNFNATTNPNHATAQFSHDCLSCHSNIAWKPSTFNHSTTSFPLLGAHAAVICSDCHKNGQYKGTTTDCYTCHLTDFTGTTAPSHTVSQFSHDCMTCHSNVAWKPATFNHSTTAFPLLGAHVSAVCSDCHKNGQYKGTTTICYNCHLTDYTATTNPAHATAHYPTDCMTCHTTTAWKPSTFNHALYFPIAAGDKHRPGRWTTCQDCHENVSNSKSFTCITCHEHNKTSMDSKHQGRVGYLYDSNACYKCHPKGRS